MQLRVLSKTTGPAFLICSQIEIMFFPSIVTSAINMYRKVVRIDFGDEKAGLTGCGKPFQSLEVVALKHSPRAGH